MDMMLMEAWGPQGQGRAAWSRAEMSRGQGWADGRTVASAEKPASGSGQPLSPLGIPDTKIHVAWKVLHGDPH